MKFSKKLSILTKKRIVEFYKSGLEGEKQIRQKYGVTPLLLEKLVRWYNQYFLNPQKDYYQTVKPARQSYSLFTLPDLEQFQIR